MRLARLDPTLPAAWAHPSWYRSAGHPRSIRALREANIRLLDELPALRHPLRATELPAFTRLHRPAFARFCRLAAACALAPEVRKEVSRTRRQLIGTMIGSHPFFQLQHDVAGSSRLADHSLAVDITDRDAMTRLGLALCLRTLEDQSQGVWLSVRLPRTWDSTRSQMHVSADTAASAVRLAWLLSQPEARRC